VATKQVIGKTTHRHAKTLDPIFTNSRVNIGLNPQKLRQKVFIVLSASAPHGEFQKNVSINLTPGMGLICIFSKLPPMKLLLTVYV